MGLGSGLGLTMVSSLGSTLPMTTVSRLKEGTAAPLSTPLTTPSGDISVELATIL